MNHFEVYESYIPIVLNSPWAIAAAFGVVLFFVVFRYFLMVGPFHLIFYMWRPKWTKAWQIYAELPGHQEQLFEIKWSLITSLIFAAAGVFIGEAWERGWTQIYLNFDEYGWWYLALSPLLLSLVHESYFYWTHRWLHLPKVFRKYHRIHHASLKPSPWASFSFHPVESLINAAAVPLMILIIPVHPVIILGYLTVMTLSAITNHMGFEILPRGALNYWLGRQLISGVHHTEHHKYFNANYGLFYTFWDNWMGTEYAKYAEEFAQIGQEKPGTMTASIHGSYPDQPERPLSAP